MKTIVHGVSDRRSHSTKYCHNSSVQSLTVCSRQKRSSTYKIPSCTRPHAAIKTPNIKCCLVHSTYVFIRLSVCAKCSDSLYFSSLIPSHSRCDTCQEETTATFMHKSSRRYSVVSTLSYLCVLQMLLQRQQRNFLSFLLARDK